MRFRTPGATVGFIRSWGTTAGSKWSSVVAPSGRPRKPTAGPVPGGAPGVKAGFLGGAVGGGRGSEGEAFGVDPPVLAGRPNSSVNVESKYQAVSLASS